MSALVQQSEEWLNFRKSKIGASDAPIIMGVSPWKTAHELWMEKMSCENTVISNSSMERGIELEPIARDLFENLLSVKVEPRVKIHPKYEWMIASLDGIDDDQKIMVEIKCPNKRDHKLAEEGKIPDKYYPQLQHQLEVCQLDMGYYFSFNGKNTALVKIYRNDEYIKLLIREELKFYECMINFIVPKPYEDI